MVTPSRVVATSRGVAPLTWTSLSTPLAAPRSRSAANWTVKPLCFGAVSEAARVPAGGACPPGARPDGAGAAGARGVVFTLSRSRVSPGLGAAPANGFSEVSRCTLSFDSKAVSYTHLRAHETDSYIVC